ncbi:hypothetical protein Btru_060088 [Bulinus truncatus]|nr:hypothetical protein Btru_060088 [Bulinus truncatus]
MAEGQYYGPGTLQRQVSVYDRRTCGERSVYMAGEPAEKGQRIWQANLRRKVSVIGRRTCGERSAYMAGEPAEKGELAEKGQPNLLEQKKMAVESRLGDRCKWLENLDWENGDKNCTDADEYTVAVMRVAEFNPKPFASFFRRTRWYPMVGL